RKDDLLDQVVRNHADAAVVVVLSRAHRLDHGVPPSASIGLTTPLVRTMTRWTTTRKVTPIGSSITWRPYIWPKLRTSKNAPAPAAFIASLALIAMNCASKFCCE